MMTYVYVCLRSEWFEIQLILVTFLTVESGSLNNTIAVFFVANWLITVLTECTVIVRTKAYFFDVSVALWSDPPKLEWIKPAQSPSSLRAGKLETVPNFFWMFNSVFFESYKKFARGDKDSLNEKKHLSLKLNGVRILQKK